MKYHFYYLLLINIVSFIYYGVDKYLAKKNKSRISETWLLSLGFIGGSFGSLSGMFYFRHKTKKIKFYLINFITLSLWIYGTIMFMFN